MADSIIRPMRPSDAADMYELRTRPNAMWGTLQLPTILYADVAASCAAQPDNHKLVAEVEGKAVGSLWLNVGAARLRHTGYIGMCVHDQYQGRGLGKALMAAALDLADNWLGLERVVLDVYPDNERAVNLYRKFGFVEEGRSPAAYRREGLYVDALHMARLRGRAAAAAATPLPGFLSTPCPAEPPLPSPAAVAALPSAYPVFQPQAFMIRAARVEDAPAIHALFLQPDVLPGLNRLPALQVDAVQKELSGLTRTQHLTVAEANGQIVGAALLNQRFGRLANSAAVSYLAVSDEWHDRGVDTALLQFLIGLADDWLGVRRLTIEAPADARALLELTWAHGFRLEAVHRAAMIKQAGFVDVCLLAREGRL